MIGKPKYLKIFQKAKKEIYTTDHLIYVTYNLIKETKFLISITEHIINAVQLAVEALLEFEKHFKRLEPFSRNLVIMSGIYSNKIEERYELDPNFSRFIRKLIELKSHIQKSEMRFRRKDKYILATKKYDTKTLDINIIKNYHKKAERFVDAVEEVLNKNG